MTALQVLHSGIQASMILTTHLMEEASFLSDRIAVLVAGRLVAILQRLLPLHSLMKTEPPPMRTMCRLSTSSSESKRGCSMGHGVAGHLLLPGT
ncbi:hypothetical protein EMIHUDRAFT_226028 [Emiliania huxleyi CCMP1516]|uniref:Uncharacterized protein n=2 Tax=Emiliania huxleyi TaxID=2903 RepID=A0A0D3KMQ9_EMIH1|nr:hypothetical protein EMIHUDRAFT_226028 [Emiliania huxleyi CCMP1516]EOD37044.1 hypothetical protein EMIHUDRAFT_226028 [Emiliania huxleyi CCMP1516]|eukprot:XP_005789473.1 hypothetical protein EMIHUDRAFT_226028 [Emiliania huxleyi CCMP1516]